MPNTSVLIALFSLTPISLLLFARLPARRAVIGTLLIGWLFLPAMGGIVIPGLPDYTKGTATGLNALLGVVLFDGRRLMRFRLAWYDVPVLVFCTSGFVSCWVNGQGTWSGISFVAHTLLFSGVPYLLGRVYFCDAAALKELALGIFIGGLIYIPLCLWEVRMSPELAKQFYGERPTRLAHAMRYGGYKPIVFMSGGLMVAMWMSVASLCGIWLRSAVRRLWGIPLPWLTLGLIVTTILCKSAGAIILLLVGIICYHSARYARTALPLIATIVFVPTYMIVRSTGTLTGEKVMELASDVFDQERVASLGTRLTNEDLLSEHALEQPFFGWGSGGDFHVVDDRGRQLTVADGLWVIVLGKRGLVGLVAMTLAMLLPAVLFLLRVPVRRWSSRRLAPCAGMTVAVVMYSVDCLPNAMLNPFILLAWGGLSAFETRAVFKRTRQRTPLSRPRRLSAA